MLNFLFTLLTLIVLLGAGAGIYLSLMDVCDRRALKIIKYIRTYNVYVVEILKRTELMISLEDKAIFNEKDCYKIRSLFKSKWHLIKNRDVRNSIRNFTNSQFYIDRNERH